MSWKKPNEEKIPFNCAITVKTVDGRQRAVMMKETPPEAVWYSPFGNAKYVIHKKGPAHCYSLAEPWEAIHPNDVVTWRKR
jgi:hypothetical protein